MFELEGVNAAEGKRAMRLAEHKLPIKCKFVQRQER
jgi:ribosomal protein L16/L10AE